MTFNYYKILLAEQNIPVLTYQHTDIILVGTIVKVPFRNKHVFGVIQSSDIPNFNLNKIKTIVEITPYQLTETHLELISTAAKYYLSNASNFLKMALPIKNIINELPLDKKNDTSINNNVSLSSAQQVAFEQIENNLKSTGYQTILLDGITGSGKTEIYFSLIENIISSNNKTQILILVPEILLTVQLVVNFKKRFGFNPAIWHSGISASKKEKLWYQIFMGQVQVIIGTRSALFLPYHSLSLIIIEEEHDSSYKQEDNIIYNARDMGIMKAFIEKIPAILVSATPSIETYHNVKENKYKIVKIEERYNNATLPNVIVTTLKNNLYKNCRWLSKTLVSKIKQELDNKNQIILFINRRGYANLLMCKSCGYRSVCKYCSSWLVEHRSKKKLECHHCNYTENIFSTCPECNLEDAMISCGTGVERISEEIIKVFPFSNTEIITRDTMNTKKKIDNIISKIHNLEINIIIGTQIIAKGHHFPKVSLVGIIDADSGLSGGDLKAAERTFQLLEQVSGRAGRETNKGQTIIQTYNEDNQTIKAIASHDRNNFYESEISIRKMTNMPPFSKLAIIVLSGKNLEKLDSISKHLAKKINLFSYIEVLGPAQANPFKIHNKFRIKILLRCPKNISIQNIISNSLQEVTIPSSISIKIDIDPYNFL
jgi:primosomal protein N' (replication factor Y) (superfamily II helicase)